MSIHTKAAGFAAGYGTLALAWTILGRGFPFGPGATHNDMSALRGLSPAAGAPLTAGIMLVTAVVMLVMNGTLRPARAIRAALLAYSWIVVFLLVIIAPDIQVLTTAGYAPLLIAGAPFGYPDIPYSDIFTWTLINQIVLFAGGVLLARATWRWQTATGAVKHRRWTTPESAARWGRWAVVVAALVPAHYAVVRLAWFAGIPLGIPESYITEMRSNGMIYAGAGLGAFALAGAILTLGLAQRWGEVFPRWMVGLAGKPVPVRLATVPAGLVALAVTAGSAGMVTTDDLFATILDEPIMMSLPLLFFPLWGVALGAATLAYHLRRQGARGVVQPATAVAY